MQRFFKIGLVLPLALATLGLAGCPGHLDGIAWVRDGGPSTPPPPPPPQAPDAAPMMVDAQVVLPPMPDAGAAPVDGAVASAPDGPIRSESWCAIETEVVARIFQPKCGACHGNSTRAGDLDLTSPDVRARLVDVPSAACRDQRLVVTTPQVGGHLFLKLENAVNGCGVRMPAGGLPWLTATEVQCLKDWISPPAASR